MFHMSCFRLWRLTYVNCCKSKWTHALESWISKPALGLLHFLYDILLYFFFILFYYFFF